MFNLQTILSYHCCWTFCSW